MKKIIVRILGCIVVVVCFISIIKFIFLDDKIMLTKENSSHSEVIDSESEKQQNTDIVKNDENGTSNDEVWNKISSDCGGSIIAEIDDTVMQDDWAYHVNSYHVTKEKGNWENSDSNIYKFDDDGNLVNKYSFIVINITVECKNKSDAEFWLNGMTFLIYDANGKNVGGSEMNAAAIDKPMSKSFYLYNLELGDILTTDIIFVLEDNMISEKNNYLLSINNTGMASSNISPEDHSNIRIPIKEE